MYHSIYLVCEHNENRAQEALHALCFTNDIDTLKERTIKLLKIVVYY